MEFIQYTSNPCNPLFSTLYPCLSICIQIDLLHYFQNIIAVQICIHLISQLNVLCYILDNDKIIGIDQLIPFTLGDSSTISSYTDISFVRTRLFFQLFSPISRFPFFSLNCGDACSSSATISRNSTAFFRLSFLLLRECQFMQFILHSPFAHLICLVFSLLSDIKSESLPPVVWLQCLL